MKKTILQLLLILPIFVFMILLSKGLVSTVYAEGDLYPCNRQNQVQIGQVNPTYTCQRDANGCSLTAWARYQNTTDENGDGVADPNNFGDQPWCDNNCADPKTCPSATPSSSPSSAPSTCKIPMASFPRASACNPIPAGCTTNQFYWVIVQPGTEGAPPVDATRYGANNACSVHSDCPKNTSDPSNVSPNTSNWCYAFTEGNRCIQLRHVAGSPSCGSGGTCSTSQEAARSELARLGWPDASRATCQQITNKVCTDCTIFVPPNAIRTALCPNTCGGSSPPPANSGSINGTVRNFVNNALLPGVTVSLVGSTQTTTTSATGAWTMSNISAGSHNFTFSKTGFTTKTETVIILVGRSISKHVQLTPVTTPTSTPGPTATGTPRPTGTGTPRPTGTPTATPAPVFTTKFRIAENPTDLAAAPWKDYTVAVASTPFDYTFKDPTAGPKFIFVQFMDSNGKVTTAADCPKCQAQIKLLGPDPTMTNCSLSFENSNAILHLTGQNFGSEKGSIKSGDTNLQIRTWKNDSIEAILQNPPTGQILPVTFSNTDEQAGSDQCSSISQLSLGAKVFCRAPASYDTDNVALALVDEAGKKVRQTVRIDRNGVVQNLTQRLEDGKRYALSIKAPKSLRRNVPFTAGIGTVSIPNFILPVGDIFPADGGDGAINALDKSELNREWNISGNAAGRPGDFNQDGKVNSIDWACMRYDFGQIDHPEPTLPPPPSPNPTASESATQDISI